MSYLPGWNRHLQFIQEMKENRTVIEDACCLRPDDNSQQINLAEINAVIKLLRLKTVSYQKIAYLHA